MPVGKSIRVYLADATVSGVRYAELVNWTGQALACPRNRLGELASWPEASKPGVYFLFEARQGDAKPLTYVGESENVAGRLTSHDKEKEFWNEVVIFTSKDENLTKSHVKFLESSFAALALQADRYELANGNRPTESSLPRADRDTMAEFVQNARMVLGTLGYPVLEPLINDGRGNSKPSPHAPQPPPPLQLIFKIGPCTAYGSPTDEGFVLKKGSQVTKGNTDSAAPRVVALKDQLIADGRLVADGDRLVLQEDVLMSSSSYAAVMVAGTSRSGPQSWLTHDGRTLKAVEDAALKT